LVSARPIHADVEALELLSEPIGPFVRTRTADATVEVM
jgi:hypothetical protein